MNRSDNPSLQRTFALAAAVAALGAWWAFPSAQAAPAGQQQAIGDGSAPAARKGIGTTQFKIEKGASQHKSWKSQTPSPAESEGIIVVVKPGAQVPAAQKK